MSVLSRLVTYPALPSLILAAWSLHKQFSLTLVAAYIGIAVVSAGLALAFRCRAERSRSRAIFQWTVITALWLAMPVALLVVNYGIIDKLLYMAGLNDAPASERRVEQINTVNWDAGGSKKTADPVTERQLTTADWPFWRGGTRNGIAAFNDPPAEWGPDRNVLWRVEIGGRGHSSPIVVGDRIYLTTADEEKSTQGVLALDANSGARVWSTKLHSGELVSIHKKNSHASSTPACDGRRIYSAFLTNHEGKKGIWVTALNLDGTMAWQTFAGKFENIEGYGASVCLHHDTLFVGGDNLAVGFLIALHTADGNVRWQAPRFGKASYATPVVATLAGRTQLLYHGCGTLVSYDPDTGAELWKCTGLADYAANTPSFDDKAVYVSGGNNQRGVWAVRADGKGDVTTTHVVWKKTRGAAYVPSMLVSNGRLYVGNDAGIVTCYACENGKQLWQERMGSGFSASPVKAGNLIFWPDERGVVFAFRDSNDYELVATNNLNNGGMASLAVSRNRIFIRTDHYLFCIGPK